jgi:hypothetical protein
MKMLYRLEREDDDYFSVRHVETDQELGRICAGTFVDRDHGLVDGYTVVNNVYDELVKQVGAHMVSPLVTARRVVAANQEYRGYSELKGVANVDLGRLELRLGTLIADAARAYARCVLEASNQGLTPQTRDACAQSLAALGDLFVASQAGCFNATTNEDEPPYFTNPLPSRQRLNFCHAAVIYGLAALRIRYPDFTDAERQKALDWVLGWLADLLANYEADCKATRH